MRTLIPDLQLIEARAIGGGARSQRWNQIKADVLGVPYRTLKRAEFATWGSALIAGHAVGLYPDLAGTAAAAAEPAGNPVLPQPEAVAVYRRLIPQYIAWQKRLSAGFLA